MLFDPWQWVQQFLTLPWLGGLAAILSIGVTVYKMRRAIARWFRAAQRRASTATAWVIEQWRHTVRAICSDSGMVTKAELDARLAEVNRSADAPATGSHTRLSPMIERLGVKVGLTPSIYTHLGVNDPARMDSYEIDRLLHGPFCRACNYNLVTWDDNIGGRIVLTTCPNCSVRWASGRSYFNRDQFKERIYRMLDAEFRTNGTLGATDAIAMGPGAS